MFHTLRLEYSMIVMHTLGCTFFVFVFILIVYLHLYIFQSTEIATQQLLLDVYNVKTILLSMPNMGMSVGGGSGYHGGGDSEVQSFVTPMYVKLITSKITQIEILLKLVGTSLDLLLERWEYVVCSMYIITFC